MSRVLLTGGAGFIGSHTCSILLQAGYELIILDGIFLSSNIWKPFLQRNLFIFDANISESTNSHLVVIDEGLNPQLW